MSILDRLLPGDNSRSATESLEPDPEIDVDDALSLIATERRRLAIRFAIEDSDGVFDLVDVVRYITTYQYGTDYTSSERKRVYISLYQSHMPKLVEAGVLGRIDDGDGHTFRVEESARPLYDLLDTATARFGGDD